MENQKTIYKLYPPFLSIPEEHNFTKTWESFCCKLLNRYYQTNTIIRRTGTEFGIDIWYPEERIAFQCKAVESGKDSDFNTTHVSDSIERALEAKESQNIHWEEYYVCTNVLITSTKYKNLTSKYPWVKFRPRSFWEDLCEDFADEVSRYFLKLTPAPREEILQNFNRHPRLIRDAYFPEGMRFLLVLTPHTEDNHFIPMTDQSEIELLSQLIGMDIDSYPDKLLLSNRLSRSLHTELNQYKEIDPEFHTRLIEREFLYHGGEILPIGNLNIWGEFRPRSITKTTSLGKLTFKYFDPRIISRILMENIMNYHRFLNHLKWSGEANAYLLIEDVDLSLKLPEFMDDGYSYQLPEGNQIIECESSGNLDTRYESALKLSIHLIKKIFHHFSYIREEIIENLFIPNILRNIESLRTDVKTSDTVIPPLEIEIDPSLREKLMTFKKWMKYINTENLSFLNQLNLENLHIDFDTNKQGEITSLTIQPSKTTLNTFPRAICNLVRLKNLELNRHHLTEIPEEIMNLSDLEVLMLTDNRLNERSFPQSIVKLKHLESLYLYKNQLKTIPDCLFKIPILKVLDLVRNQLEAISPNIQSLKHLEVLLLNHNNLNDLPRSISKIPSLKSLEILNNKFTDIPYGIWDCTQLESLRISNIHLAGKSLDKLGNLSSLKHLYLTNCGLKTLHASIRNLHYLTLVDLGENPIKGETKDLLRKMGFQETMKNFFRKKSSIDF